MTKVFIDTEKLASGLEQGIADSNDFFSYYPAEHRLRGPVCGVVSTAIQLYLHSSGIDSELIISKPKLPFDSSLEHVYLLIGMVGTDRVVVDASYSQFLSFVGLREGYEIISKESVYPAEKILDFNESQRGLVVNWLGMVANRFRTINSHPITGFDIDLGAGPMNYATTAELKTVFNSIWDPKNAELWVPDKFVLQDAAQIAQRIPKNCVQLIS